MFYSHTNIILTSEMDHYRHNVLFTHNIILHNIMFYLTSEMDHYRHNVLFTHNIILTSETDHYPHNVLFTTISF